MIEWNHINNSLYNYTTTNQYSTGVQRDIIALIQGLLSYDNRRSGCNVIKS